MSESETAGARLSERNLVGTCTELGQLLKAKGWLVGTAESCTGGMIASAITDIAGSSTWFEEGLVTYSNSAKSHWLGVSERVLEEHGAVSRQVIEAMARGVIKNGAQVAVATSGIAGPGGGSKEKPVGLVWFGWAIGEQVYTERRIFSGSRLEVRTKATEYGLFRLLEIIKEH